MPHIHKTLIIPARIMATSQSMPSGAGRWGRTNFALRSSTKFVLLRQGPVPHPWSQPQSNRTKTGRRLELGCRLDLLPLLLSGVGVSGVPKPPAPALPFVLIHEVPRRSVLRSWAMSSPVGAAMLGPVFAFDSVPAKKGAMGER